MPASRRLGANGLRECCRDFTEILILLMLILCVCHKLISLVCLILIMDESFVWFYLVGVFYSDVPDVCVCVEQFLFTFKVKFG